MIKTGIILPDSSSAPLIRLLLHHPDVELRWLARPDGSAPQLDALLGELPKLSAAPDWAETDLYIGPGTAAVIKRLGEPEAALRAVLWGGVATATDFPEGIAAEGVAEFNRKALVRGARVALMPTQTTMLVALALMPLAKNLLIGPSVTGSAILAAQAPGTRLAGILPDDDLQSAREILTNLQTSFNAEIKIFATRCGESSFTGGTFELPVNMPYDEIVSLYHDFYGDHRHVVVEPAATVSSQMVLGTNKTVIALDHSAERQLRVSVGFDAAYKLGAGNIVHLLNLLFGLHERTGF